MVVAVAVGVRGSIQQVLNPADVVPSDRDWWTDAVVGQVEREIEVAFQKALRQLSAQPLAATSR